MSITAGTGIQGNSGDGGPATRAELSGPDGVALDSAGNLYIADSPNGVIRKVDAKSGVFTMAADRVSCPRGYGIGHGDGGPATSACCRIPGVAFDRVGNLYIADSQHLGVRRVSASTGIITTIAGTVTRVSAAMADLRQVQHSVPSPAWLSTALTMFILSMPGTGASAKSRLRRALSRRSRATETGMEPAGRGDRRQALKSIRATLRSMPQTIYSSLTASWFGR